MPPKLLAMSPLPLTPSFTRAIGSTLDVVGVGDNRIGTDHTSFLAALVDDGSGNSTLTLTDGTTVTFIGFEIADFNSAQTTFAPVPCFAAGMLIQTPDGLRRIEDIRADDMVTTVGHGPKPVRWAGRAKVRFGVSAHHLKPVLIKAGALAPQVPKFDLIVSPQHRILITDWRAELLFGESEVFAAAKGLINGRDIIGLEECRAIEFVHILFDWHEIVTVNGVDAESLYPGAGSLAGLGVNAETEILELFHDLVGKTDSADRRLAKPEITVREAKLLSAFRAFRSATGPEDQSGMSTANATVQSKMKLRAKTSQDRRALRVAA